MDLDPGTVVANRYRISRPLGRGGMGEVFAAENIRTGRPVAVKLLRQDTKGKSSAVARFRQEARAAGSINSDHVTQVLDVEEDPEHGVVLVFELLEGESLIDRLKRTGPIPFTELWSIIEQVWLGLADAHRAGIIHRDLKPSNVFLERRPDGTTRVKILDFGISKVPKEAGGETLTEMGQSLGTFSFMPPEQIGKAKTVDHRADVYACATMIYQSLTGQLPYAARNVLIMVELKSKTDARTLSAAMGTAFDPRLEAFVARGLSRDPALRYQTALDALASWRDLRPSSTASSESREARRDFGSALPQAPPSASNSSNANQAIHARPSVGAGALHVAPGPVAIFEKPADLPRVNNDGDGSTDEGAATLAMPRMRRDLPGEDDATGPNGTRLVDVGRARSAMPPSPRALVVPPTATVDSSQDSRRSNALSASGHLPRTYEDPISSPASDVATQLFRNRDPLPAVVVPPASYPTNQPTNQSTPAAMQAAKKKSLPLALVLLGFLLLGFLVVAGLMFLVGR